MRQKKSKIIYYIIGITLIIGIFFVATHEINVKTERVEQTIPNNFLSK